MALACSDPKFIFIHIYKCGGNSIRRLLRTPNINQKNVNDINSFEIHGVHANISDVKSHLMTNGHEDFYHAAFKFSVVRNPYSHLVSLYKYIRTSKIHQYHRLMMSKNFYQFLHWYVHEMIPMERPYGSNKYQFMHEFLSDNGNGEMDFTARLENINDDMRHVCKTLGLPYSEVPIINKHSGKKPWKEYYDSRSLDFVEEHFLEDLVMFGYK